MRDARCEMRDARCETGDGRRETGDGESGRGKQRVGGVRLCCVYNFFAALRRMSCTPGNTLAARAALVAHSCIEFHWHATPGRECQCAGRSGGVVITVHEATLTERHSAISVPSLDSYSSQ